MASPSQFDLQNGVPSGANIVKRVPGPGGQGELLLDASGAVYGVGGATATGSYFSFGEGARNNPNRKFNDIVVNPDGSYKILADDGANYAFDAPKGAPAPALPDSLMTDPAFLAFLRTSGQTIETAANQVNRQKGAINQALQTSLGDEAYGTQKNQKQISGGFQAKGITQSGAHQKALQEEERASAIRRSKIQTDAATQISGLSEGLANKVIEVQQQAAERGLSTGQQQALDQGIESIRKKPEYRDYFAQGGK